MSRTLLITNDFPPRPGGIQQFVHNLAIRQPAGSLVVYASQWAPAKREERAPASADVASNDISWEKFDADQPYPVIREDTSVLLPTPAVAGSMASLKVTS